jgi:hypothetical protein
MDLYTLTQEIRDSAIHCGRVWVTRGGLDVVWEVAPSTFIAVVRDGAPLGSKQFDGATRTTIPMVFGWRNLVSLHDDCAAVIRALPDVPAYNAATTFLCSILMGLHVALTGHMRVRMDIDAT